MAKITEQQRNEYRKEINSYQDKIKTISKRIQDINQLLAKNDPQTPRLRIEKVNITLQQISYYTAMNEISINRLEVKNTGFLENARKALYNVIITLEKQISAKIDASYTEYEDGVNNINFLKDVEKLKIIIKLGYSIHLVTESFGDISKWKWSFVELSGRFATCAKNIINLKDFLAKMDPRIEGYNERMRLKKIAIQHLNESSHSYREKFEISTQRADDLNKALHFQKALFRLHTLFHEDEIAQTCKKQIEVWKGLMERYEKEKKLL